MGFVPFFSSSSSYELTPRRENELYPKSNFCIPRSRMSIALDNDPIDAVDDELRRVR